ACDTLRTAADLLAAVEEETEVPRPLLELSGKLEGNICDDLIVVQHARDLVKKTSETYEGLSIKRGQSLVVRVERINPSRTWEVTFDTGPKGDWRTSYGFGFIASAFAQPERFVAKQIEGDGFRIEKEENRDRLDFIPALFLTWMSAEHELEDLVYSPSLGLGFDLRSPVVLGGLAFTYNHNISLNVGLAFHQQKRLAGQYNEGDVVRENLQSEQLHEEIYVVNPFFSFSIRSLSNPFKGSD
ncbi:MAG TPA: hypothetical protein VEY33_14020, partial [Gemmatimonadota bacterium]|nr:hypothetical protein [Gemmatimonadota bacterium]